MRRCPVSSKAVSGAHYASGGTSSISGGRSGQPIPTGTADHWVAGYGGGSDKRLHLRGASHPYGCGAPWRWRCVTEPPP